MNSTKYKMSIASQIMYCEYTAKHPSQKNWPADIMVELGRNISSHSTLSFFKISFSTNYYLVKTLLFKNISHQNTPFVGVPLEYSPHIQLCRFIEITPYNPGILVPYPFSQSSDTVLHV